MPSYSREQFVKDWRYKIDKDFQTSSGQNYPYAHDGFKTWGEELYKIPYDKSTKPEDVFPPMTCASVSSDGKLLAIAANEQIDVYETETFANLYHLQGHASTVDGIAFQPGNSNVIVSSATQHRGGSRKADCEVIFWTLNEPWVQSLQKVNNISGRVATKATRSIVQELESLSEEGVQLNDDHVVSLQSDITKSISKGMIRNVVPAPRRMNARILTDNFQSKAFSPSGNKLIYLPGNRPRSNGNVPWNVGVLSVTSDDSVTPARLVLKPLYDLVGHTDAIMWASFNHDESLIGTVCWDKTIRIWDGKDGSQKFLFETTGQNWAGDFSSDSQLFAATCGDGTMHVYSLTDGSTLLSHDFKADWCRRLAWHPKPSKNLIAISGGTLGELFLYDIEKKEVVQERKLSLDAAKLDDENLRPLLRGYLVVSHVLFKDAGKKLVTLTSGDGGIEVYDFEKGTKYRFARPGTVAEEERSGLRRSSDKPLNEGGFDMVVWEDAQRKGIMMASLDGDTVRIWKIPMHDAGAS